MSRNFLIGGVIMSPLVLQLLLAVLATCLISFVLMRLNLYRWVWHRPLAELCLFCIALGTIVALAPDGWPIWPFASHEGHQP